MKIDLPLTINSKPKIGEYTNGKIKGMYAEITFKIAMKVYWRSILSESQNHKCCWCGIETTERRDLKNSSTIEHVIPLGLGGDDLPTNMVMSCYYCNNRRGTKNVDEFINELKFGPVNKPKDFQGRHPGPKYTNEQIMEFRKYGLNTKRSSKPGRIKKRQIQLDVLKAIAQSSINPFEINSQMWKMFNRYQASSSFQLNR